jgi:hypothetical protein
VVPLAESRLRRLALSLPLCPLAATIPCPENEAAGAEWLAEFRRDLEAYITREVWQALWIPAGNGRVRYPYVAVRRFL